MIINTEHYTRPRRWRSMKPLPGFRLLAMNVATAVALSWSITALVRGGLGLYNAFLSGLQRWTPRELPVYYQFPWQWVWIIGIYLWLLSPLVLDAALKSYYPLQSLIFEEIESQYPESVTLWRTFLGEHPIIRPKFKLLMTDLPIALSYSGTPRTATLVISRGLLQQLTDQELAAITAAELGKIKSSGCFWFSGVAALLQLPHFLYRQICKWGDKRKFPHPFAISAAFFWCVYWLLRLPALWLSRMRVYYSDRYAVELTGNPNGLGAALLKIAGGITAETIRVSYLHPLLESFDICLPLDPQEALSIDPAPSILLAWDCNHPSRFTRSLLFTHPPLGERLYILGKCAEFWRVKSPWSLPERSTFNPLQIYRHLPLFPRAMITGIIIGTLLRSLFWLVGFLSVKNGFQPFMWMAEYSPLRYWLGWVIIGFLLAVIWLIGQRIPALFIWVVFLKLGWDNLNLYSLPMLSWLFTDDRLLLPWMGIVFSVVIIGGANSYFPDTLSEKTDLSQLLNRERITEPEIKLVRLEGKLLGHEGVSDWLVRDLRLHTDSGSIKLRYATSLGLLGNLLSLFPRPCEFTGQRVIVRGWLHLCNCPWIDVDTITVAGGETVRSNYRVWLLILAFAAAIWSAYQLYKI